MAEQNKPKGQAPTTPAPSTPEAPAPTVARAVAVDALPGKLYERTPNPRTEDVKALVANPVRLSADGTPALGEDGKPQAQWYKITEKNEKDAQTAAQHIRRAGKELNIKLAVKLPATEKGSVYFAARLSDDGKVQEYGA